MLQVHRPFQDDEILLHFNENYFIACDVTFGDKLQVKLNKMTDIIQKRNLTQI